MPPSLDEMVRKVLDDAARRRAQGKCPVCGQKTRLSDFLDELSVREYRISGLCQACQDATFESDDDEEEEDR